MTNNNSFSEENPFEFIKVRQILLCFVLITIGLALQVSIISLLFGYKDLVKNPILPLILIPTICFLTIVWLLRKFNAVGIKAKYIIGKIPNNYQWLSLIALVIARVFFAKSLFRIVYHPLYLLAPSLTENILRETANNDTYIANLPNNLKIIYYIFAFILVYLVLPTFYVFIINGITLHRWAAKWGTKKALLVICIILSLLAYKNILAHASYFLVYLLLYIKTRTLIIPLVANLLEMAVFRGVDLLTKFLNGGQSTTLIEIARSEFWLGVLYFALSAPLVIYFIYKNWPNRNTQLPYFANKAKESIKADSAF